MTYFGCIPNMFGYFVMPNYFMLGAMKGYSLSMFNFALTNPSIFIAQPYCSNYNMGNNIQMPHNSLAYSSFNFTMPEPPKRTVQNNYYIPHYEYSQIQPSPLDYTYGDIFGPPCTTGYSNWDTIYDDVISRKFKINSKLKTDDSAENIDRTTSDPKINNKVDSINLDSRLGEGFTQKVKQIANDINCDWKDLVGVMQAESGLNPKAWNGKSAVGLIQFTQISIDDMNQFYSLNLTKDKIANMSAVEQLDYVEKYLKLVKKRQFANNKKLSAGDLYALVFLPGRANREILTSRAENFYSSNRGLDLDHDNSISKQDLINQVNRKKLEIFA